MNICSSGVSKSLLALTLALALSACGGEGGDGGSGEETPDNNNDSTGDNGSVVVSPSDSGGSPGPALGDGEVGSAILEHINEPKEALVKWAPGSTLMNDRTEVVEAAEVAVSPAGNVIAVWVQDTGSNPGSLWGRYFNRSSGTWGRPTELSNGRADVSGHVWDPNPKVVFIGEIAIVAWDQMNTIYSATHDKNGWSGNPQHVFGQGTFTTEEASFVSLTAKEDGSGVVAVYGTRNGFYEPGVTVERPVSLRSSEFSLVTRNWSVSEVLGTHIDQAGTYSYQVVTDPKTGTIHAAWRSEDYEVTSASFKNGTWTTPHVHEDKTFSPFTIQPDPLSDHPIVIYAVSRGVKAERNVKGVWETTTVSSLRSPDQIRSTILSGGDVMITYHYIPELLTNPKIKGVVTQRLQAEVNLWKAPVEHERESTGIKFSVLAADNNGRAVLAYNYQYSDVGKLANFSESEDDGWQPVYQPADMKAAIKNRVSMNEAGDAAMAWVDPETENAYVLLGR